MFIHNLYEIGLAMTTLITDESIITKFHAFKDEYTLFTTHSRVGDFQYQSIIKYSKNHRTLWDVRAVTMIEAIVNHIALFNMASKYRALEWNQHLLELSKPVAMLDKLFHKDDFATQHTLNSGFTKKILKTAGISAIQTEVTEGMRNQLALFLLFLLVILGWGLAIE